MTTHHSSWMIWRWPLLLAVLIVFGLLSALLGQGASGGGCHGSRSRSRSCSSSYLSCGGERIGLARVGTLSQFMKCPSKTRQAVTESAEPTVVMRIVAEVTTASRL